MPKAPEKGVDPAKGPQKGIAPKGTKQEAAKPTASKKVLANTGASVLGMIAAATLLAAAGIFVLRRRNA